MKKLITLILTFTFALAAVPVEAAKSPSLDFLKASYKDSKYYNISQSGSLSFKLHKPIPGLDFLDEMMDSNDSPLDIKALVEGLFDSQITYTAKQKTTNAGEKAAVEMQMKSNAPVRINNNFELAVNTNYSVWADLDVSDEKNPSMDFIMSTPQNKRYITMNVDDFTEYMDEEELAEYNEAMGMISQIYSSDVDMTELQNKMVESIYANASVTGTARDIKIKFSDLGLKKYFADVYEIVMSLYSEEMQAGSEEFIETLKDVAINVPFFSDDALVIEYKLDSKNRVISEKIELNVDLDVFELLSYLEEDTEGLSEGNCDVSFSIAGEAAFKYNTVNVKKPELTDENSVSIIDLIPAYDPIYEEYDEYEEYYSPYVYCYIDENFYGSNREKYVPLRSLLEEFDYEVSYDNGIITATSDSKYAEYDSMIFNTKSSVVNTNTVSYTMSAAPIIINDKSYIALTDAEMVLNFETDSYSYYPNNMFGYVDIERNAYEEDFE